MTSCRDVTGIMGIGSRESSPNSCISAILRSVNHDLRDDNSAGLVESGAPVRYLNCLPLMYT